MTASAINSVDPADRTRRSSLALVVEDDADASDVMAQLIRARGFAVAQARTLREARAQIAFQHPDLILLDLNLPDGSGLPLCEDTALLGGAEVVLITGHASLETSIQAMRLGVADYLIKPVSLKQLDAVLSRVKRSDVLSAELDSLEQDLEHHGRFGRLVGRSEPMRRVYDQLARAARTSVTVMLEGESGTGKELAARMIHELSRRRQGPFLAVNCGAISPNLLESEMFGHEKGSFTGADRQHIGFLEQARGGTLFLDEITEMPASMQVKLLRVLEAGTFMRVGSTHTLQADVRIVAATNRLPLEAIRAGLLREDLFYRLGVFPIVMPSLRARPSDVPALAIHFAAQISQLEKDPKTLSESACARLMTFDWPGNVRQLRNAIYQAYVMAPGRVIDEEHLMVRRAPGTEGTEGTGVIGVTGVTALKAVAGGPATAGADPELLTVRIGESLASIERTVILATFEFCARNKERTASVLGVSLKTLYNRLREYGEGSPSEPARRAGGNGG